MVIFQPQADCTWLQSTLTCPCTDAPPLDDALVGAGVGGAVLDRHLVGTQDDYAKLKHPIR